MLHFNSNNYLRTAKAVILETFSQFEKGSTTAYGEPQAWVEFDNRYILEITEEQDMIPEDEYFYSVRLYYEISEEENESEIVDTYSTDGVSEEQLEALLGEVFKDMEKYESIMKSRQKD